MANLTDNAKRLIDLLDDAFAEADENDAPILGWVYINDRKGQAGMRHLINKHPRIARQIEVRNDYYGQQARWCPNSMLPY
jgi:hypothetical protein